MTKDIKTKELIANKIIQLYTVDHLSYYQIAKHCHTDTDNIHNILYANNVKIRHICHSINISFKELNQLYTIEHLPSTEIAKRFGVTFPTVLNKLREYNIPINPKHGSPFNKLRIKLEELPSIIKEPKIIKQSLTGKVTCPSCGKTRSLTLNRPRIKDIVRVNGRCTRCATSERAIPLDSSTIKHLYENEHLSTNDIASKYKVSPHVIIKNLRHNNSHIRPKDKTRKLMFQKTIQNKGTLEAPVLSDIHKGTEIGLKNQSYYVWVECQRCNGLRWEVKSRMKIHPLCKPCAMKQFGVNHQGENAIGWLGGLSFEPYGVTFNKTLREQIRERDNHTCQLCGLPQNGYGLACHHINYIKTNNHPNNLISLCPRNCHLKTNHKREYWTRYFNNLLKERGVLVPTS